MTDSDVVNTQITDSVTQANVSVLGLNTAFSLAQSELLMAQSQGVLFANMVSGFQQSSIASSAATMQSVIQLLNTSNSKTDQHQETIGRLRNIHDMMKNQLNANTNNF